MKLRSTNSRRLLRQTVFLGFFALAISALACNAHKTAYVNLNTLYDTIPLKKELNEKLQTLQKIKRDRLDSMYNHLSLLDDMNKKGEDVGQEFSHEKDVFEKLKDKYEDENDMVIKNFDKQIWDKVTAELKEYGEAKHYEYIFGANGSGTLMYADKDNDITEAVIKYIYQKKDQQKK